MAELGKMGFTVERLPFGTRRFIQSNQELNVLIILLITGHFAIGDYLTGSVLEQMVIMQEDLYFQYTVAFVPRLWPLLERFNDLVYRWHSSGFDKYWEYRVVTDNLNIQIQQQVESTMTGSVQDGIGPVTLGMSNFAGILLVWMLGVTVALITFAVEMLASRFMWQRG